MMKKITYTLAIVLFSLFSVKGQTVVFGDSQNPTKATGITNLNVNGASYNVLFEPAFAYEVYGSFPGSFTFTDIVSAETAVDSIISVLNADGANSVGEVNATGQGGQIFNIGYESTLVGPIESINVWRADYANGVWSGLGQNTWTYSLDERTYALFSTGSVGVNEFRKVDRDIKIYPNPASDMVLISQELEYSKIKIFNSSGTLQSIEIANDNNSLDVSTYSNGLYFIHFFDESNSFIGSEKIIIIH